MSDDFLELDQLIEHLRGDGLSESEQARLVEHLENDLDSQKRYVQQMALSAALRERAVREDENPASIRAAVSKLLDDDEGKSTTSNSASDGRAAHRGQRRVALISLATCAVVVLGLWMFWKPGAEEPSANQLAAGWKITPTGEAEFRVIQPTLVRLDRGELLVESVKQDSATGDDAPTSLRIETPHGEAFATGTRFYIGSHSQVAGHRQITPGSQSKGGDKMLKSLTRVLVLSGMVTLTTTMGSVEGTSSELLAAEPDKAPTKLVVKANSDFALDMYKQLAKENGNKNLFFSPYSISSALAMTAEGARGETAEQIGSVLHFPDGYRRVGDDAQLIPWRTSLIHTGMAALNRKLDGGNDPAKVKAINERIKKLEKPRDVLAKIGLFNRTFEQQLELARLDTEIHKLAIQVNQYQLKIANALWGDQSFPFRKEFVDTINKHYNTGGIFPVDFKTNFKAERKKINTWVEDQTNNRIKDLLPRGSVNELTRIVLTNAIYFKGDWLTPFLKEDTSDRPFTLASGKKVRTPTMFAPAWEVARYGAFNSDGTLFETPAFIRKEGKSALYPAAAGFAMVELPYRGSQLSMVLVSPYKADGLAALQKKLTPEKLQKWIAQLTKRDTDVFLPKFKMETDYTLGDSAEPGPLQRMGMTRAFVNPLEKNGAQFGGLCGSENPLEQLYITTVLHKAFIEVNEKGTEAAAAVVGGFGGGPLPHPSYLSSRPTGRSCS